MNSSGYDLQNVICTLLLFHSVEFVIFTSNATDCCYGKKYDAIGPYSRKGTTFSPGLNPGLTF